MFPFRLERLALYFITPLAAVLPRRHGAVDGVSPAARHRGVAVLRGPARRLARRAGRHVPAAGVRAAKRRVLIAAVLPLVASAALSRRVAPLAMVGAVVLGGVALTNERSELFRVTPGELKAMHRHMDRAAVGAHHADGLERVLAHRRRRGLRVAISRAAVHRLRRVDERAAVERRSRRRAGLQHVVPRAAVQARQAAGDAHHRAGRRIGRARRARVGQQEGHGRRAQPADAEVRPPLRTARGQSLRSAGRRGRAERRPQVHQPHATRSSTSSCWGSSTRGRRSRRADSRSRRTTSTRRRRFAATTTT